MAVPGARRIWHVVGVAAKIEERRGGKRENYAGKCWLIKSNN